MSLREVNLPSGATLTIQMAPFEDARNLYQAVLGELKTIGISTQSEVATLLKEVFCAAFSSKQIDALVWQCMKRCLYNNMKMDRDTFEPEENREDYITVLTEVARDNVTPFFKSLFAEYKTASSIMHATQSSK